MVQSKSDMGGGMGEHEDMLQICQLVTTEQQSLTIVRVFL